MTRSNGTAECVSTQMHLIAQVPDTRGRDIVVTVTINQSFSSFNETAWKLLFAKSLAIAPSRIVVIAKWPGSVNVQVSFTGDGILAKEAAIKVQSNIEAGMYENVKKVTYQVGLSDSNVFLGPSAGVIPPNYKPGTPEVGGGNNNGGGSNNGGNGEVVASGGPAIASGVIIGAVAGCVVATVLVGMLVYKLRKSRGNQQPSEPDLNPRSPEAIMQRYRVPASETPKSSSRSPRHSSLKQVVV